MKLIIWGCALMIVLPLLYLFWGKKRWRLLLGVVILAVLAFSYLLPSEFTYSVLTSETDKEKPLQKLEAALKNVSNTEPNPADPEKLKSEKRIVIFQKKIEEFAEKDRKGEKLSEGEKSELFSLVEFGLPIEKAEWIRKGGKKEKSPTFLFCGEQFNEELSREGKSGGKNWRKVKDYNIIGFGEKENNNPKLLKEKLQKICEQNQSELARGLSPIIGLKNIDKINDSELKKELLKIVDPDKKSDLGKYYKEIKEKNKTERREKTIDLSQFTLVATTSTSNPQLSQELRTKLKHIEPFFDKYFGTIFFSSVGMEIIIFFLLLRSRRKEKNKALK